MCLFHLYLTKWATLEDLIIRNDVDFSFRAFQSLGRITSKQLLPKRMPSKQNPPKRMPSKQKTFLFKDTQIGDQGKSNRMAGRLSGLSVFFIVGTSSIHVPWIFACSFPFRNPSPIPHHVCPALSIYQT